MRARASVLVFIALVAPALCGVEQTLRATRPSDEAVAKWASKMESSVGSLPLAHDVPSHVVVTDGQHERKFYTRCAEQTLNSICGTVRYLTKGERSGVEVSYYKRTALGNIKLDKFRADLDKVCGADFQKNSVHYDHDHYSTMVPPYAWSFYSSIKGTPRHTLRADVQAHYEPVPTVVMDNFDVLSEEFPCHNDAPAQEHLAPPAPDRRVPGGPTDKESVKHCVYSNDIFDFGKYAFCARTTTTSSHDDNTRNVQFEITDNMAMIGGKIFTASVDKDILDEVCRSGKPWHQDHNDSKYSPEWKFTISLTKHDNGPHSFPRNSVKATVGAHWTKGFALNFQLHPDTVDVHYCR